MEVPEESSSPHASIQESEPQSAQPQTSMVYLPPPSTSSTMEQEDSFFTRVNPLPTSTLMLPRTDDHGVNLHEMLANNNFFPNVQDHSFVEDEDEADDEAGSEENWEEEEYERTPSEQDEYERAVRENAENFRRNGSHQTWWETPNVRGVPSPERNPYDRSGARAGFGFRRGE